MIKGFYLDESGNTGFGDKQAQPVVCYGGVLIPHDALIKIEQEFESLSNQILSELKMGIVGVPASEIDKMPFFQNFEMHSKEFFDGDRMFSKIPPPQRFSYAERFMKILQDNDAKVIASLIHKEAYQQATGETRHTNMHSLALSKLINSIDHELTSTNHTGLIVPDNGRPDEEELLLRTLRQASSNRIFPDTFPKLSHRCSLTQLADICVFLTTIYYRTKYGYSRKKFNSELVDLYDQHMSPITTVWEYSA